MWSFSAGDKEVETIVSAAHEHNVKVIMSNHDFHATPAKKKLSNDYQNAGYACRYSKNRCHAYL